MPRPLAVFLALVAFVSACCWSLLPHRFEVVQPRFGIPAVRVAGESFGVEMRLSSPFWSPTITLSLIDEEGRAFALSSTTKRDGVWRHLEARSPMDLPPGAYRLDFDVDGRRLESPRAVYIVDKFPTEHKIVQLADLPTFGQGDGDARMRQVVSEVNTIAPDLVLVTGDIAYVGRWRHFEAAIQHLSALDAPVVIGIGNHEYKGLGAFFTIFGPLNHVVDIGDLRIITINSGHGRDQLTESQYAWLRTAFAERDGRIPILQLHHPLFWKRKLSAHVEDIVELCRLNDVPIVLSGHWHGDYVFDQSGTARDDTWDFEGTKYVVTTALGADLREPYSASPMHHGYRLIRLQDGRISNYTYDWDGDGKRHASGSIPTGYLRTEAEGPGSVTVYNDLNEHLEDALITIWADDEPAHDSTRGERRPSLGSLHDVKSVDGRIRYRIRYDLPARSSTTLTMLED